MNTPELHTLPRLDETVIEQIRQLEPVRPGLLAHLTSVFRTNTTAMLAGADGQWQRGELEALRIALHSLKGTAASLGASRLSAIASLAEQAAAGQRDAAEMPALLAQLREEFEAAQSALQAAADAGGAATR